MPNNRRLYWKVCGMRDSENILQTAALKPDFMGFIFFKDSPRYAGKKLSAEVLDQLPERIKKVGVFVNPETREVLDTAKKFKLDLIQLHGHESFAQIRELKERGMKIIQVISGNENLEPAEMREMEPFIDFWLLDNRTTAFGGTGEKFDRRILSAYSFKKPVLLSGGLDTEEVKKIIRENHPAVMGVDVNSRMEVSPGLKNIEKLIRLKECLG